MARRPRASEGDLADKKLAGSIAGRCADGEHRWAADAEARCCLDCGLFEWRSETNYEHYIDSPKPGGAMDATHCLRGHEWAVHERFQRRPPPRSGYLRYCAACKSERGKAKRAAAAKRRGRPAAPKIASKLPA